MGKPGPLAIVTPAEFKERTSLKLSSRSGTTLTVDKAYENYHATRSPVAAKLLYDALRAYLLAHGGFWNKCERNVVSGGLLEYLYGVVRPGALSPAQAADMDRRAAALIRDVEIPHARFGVLYFLANIKAEVDPFTLLVDGAAHIGASIGVGMTTDMGKLQDATNAVRNVDIGKVGVKAAHLATGSNLALKGGKAVVDQLMAPSGPRASYLPTTEAALEAMSRSTSEHFEAGRYLRAAGTAVNAVPVVAVSLVVDAARALWNAVKGAINKVSEMIKSAWQHRGDLATTQKIGALLKKCAPIAIDLIMKNAVPFLGGAIELGTGIGRSIGEACTRVASWYDRRRIELQDGHPSQIADAIESQMSKGMFRGLLEALMGAAKVAVSLFLPGLGSLVSVVMGAIDWLVRTVSRLSEQSAIGKFLAQARLAYAAEKDRAQLVDGVYQPSTEPGGLINDTQRFTKFFQQGCNASPLIPMLTLNSGLGGGPMTLIKLFTSGDKPALKANAGDQVLIADQYFTRLKRHGVGYMRESGFRVMPLKSTDKVIQGFLTHATGMGKAVGSHAAGGSWGGRVEAFVRA